VIDFWYYDDAAPCVEPEEPPPAGTESEEPGERPPRQKPSPNIPQMPELPMKPKRNRKPQQEHGKKPPSLIHYTARQRRTRLILLLLLWIVGLALVTGVATAFLLLPRQDANRQDANVWLSPQMVTVKGSLTLSIEQGKASSTPAVSARI